MRVSVLRVLPTSSDTGVPVPHPSPIHHLCSQGLQFLPAQVVMGSDQEPGMHRIGEPIQKCIKVFCMEKSFACCRSEKCPLSDLSRATQKKEHPFISGEDRKDLALSQRFDISSSCSNQYAPLMFGRKKSGKDFSWLLKVIKDQQPPAMCLQPAFYLFHLLFRLLLLRQSQVLSCQAEAFRRQRFPRVS